MKLLKKITKEIAETIWFIVLTAIGVVLGLFYCFLCLIIFDDDEENQKYRRYLD